MADNDLQNEIGAEVIPPADDTIAQEPEPLRAAPAAVATDERPRASAELPARFGGFGGSRPARATGGGRRDSGRERGSYGRRRVCGFCMDNVQSIDYKDTARLRRFLSERGKIEPRRKTGVCAKHQRWLTTALKRARQLALLPYTAEHVRFMGR